MKNPVNSDFLVCCMVVAPTRNDQAALEKVLASLNGRKELSDIGIVVQVQNSDINDIGAGGSVHKDLSLFRKLEPCVQDEKIKPGKIYRVPDNSVVTFANRTFNISQYDHETSTVQPGDYLLQSLASEFGEASVGLLLTDEVSTAILGREAISTAGGVILTPPDGDPARTDAATFADIVAPVEELGDALFKYAARFMQPKPPSMQPGRQEISEICSIVREETGHDFKHYKETTLVRRILRRISVLQCSDAEGYVAYLKKTPEESRILMRDLLIGVSAFFRDPEAFAALRNKVLKRLLSSDEPSPVRIWVAGCANGQEAYTFAMIVQELEDELDSAREVKIFATDLNERALRIARKGLYPLTIAQELPPGKLERFFNRTSHGYQAKKELRHKVVFSPHNLIGDPPYSKMDIISCRNLLIYLGTHLQKKLISVFHYGLRDGGYIFLGSSESVSGHGDLFRVVDKKHRIAQRKETVIRNSGSLRSGAGLTLSGWLSEAESKDVDIGAVAQRILLDEFSPPYLIANSEAQIQYLSAGTEDFLHPPEGQYINHVLRMTRSGLRVGLRTAWSKALKTRRTQTHEGLVIDGAQGKRRIKIVVQPMPELGEDDGSYMIVFLDRGALATDEGGKSEAGENERLVEQLENELLHTREELERTVQDLEAANEELKSSNEELLSMNEELQSANEEMETSKEEVETGSQALSAAHTDLVNLLKSTEIATLFLDNHRNLRSFTPAASKLFNIRGGDAGRPLADFTHHFVDLPDLPQKDEVKRAKEPIETPVRTSDGKAYLRRVTAYRNEEGEMSGKVVTFVDVSEQQATLSRLSDALAEINMIYDHAPVGLALIDRELRFQRVNEAMAEMNGYPAADHIDRSIFDIIPDVAPKAERILNKVLDTGKVVGPLEITGKTTGTSGKFHTWMETFVPVPDRNGRIIQVLATALDITGRKEAEIVLERSEKRLRRVIDQIAVFVGTLTPDGILTEANEPAIAASGLPRDELVGKPFWECYWWSYSRALQRQLKAVIRKAAEGETLRYDVEVRIAGNGRITIDFQIAPVYDDVGQLIELTVSGADVTVRKRYEKQLRENEERLQLAIDSAGLGIFSYDAVSDEVTWDERTVELFDAPSDLKMPFDLDYMLERIHLDDHAYVKAQLQKTFDPTGDGAYRAEHRINTRDGSARWVAVHGQTTFFGTEKNRRPLRTNGVTRDITGRKEAERGYAESLERLELALEVGRMGIWDWDIAGDELDWTDGHYRICGYEPGEVEPSYELWVKTLHPDDRDQVVHTLEKARDEKKEFSSTHRLVWPDGSVVHVSARGRFFQDETGRLVRMLGVLEDVNEIKRINMQRELLMGELNHRVKNSLATIQAMASHTMRNTPDPKEFHEKFLGRLRAISAAHEILTDHDQKQARLLELIERQVGPYTDLTTDRVRLSGPMVELSATSAHALGLVLHELTTNATKYGALSVKTGYVDIRWKQYVENNVQMVEIIWSEHGGPEVHEPENTGFGSRLIKQSFAYSLGGSATLNYLREGFQAILAVPVGADYD